MKRGPKPTPTATLRARGSWRGNARKGEPALPVCELQPPEWLPDVGKEMFVELAAVLFDAGLTTRADALALTMLCKSYADFRKADDIIVKEGEVISCGNGGRKLHPLVILRTAAQERIEKGLACFGLTPADRSRVVALPQGGTGGLSLLLREFRKPQNVKGKRRGTG